MVFTNIVMICEFSHGNTKSIQNKVLRKFLENVGRCFTFVRDIWTGREHVCASRRKKPIHAPMVTKQTLFTLLF
jgi:hypothetical protein